MGRIAGKHIKCVVFPPEHLMELAGYIPLPNGSWIFPFKGRSALYEKHSYRFHVYLIEHDTLEIHTDLIKHRYGREFHIASTYQMKEEAKRLRAFMTPPPQPKGTRKKRKKDVFVEKESFDKEKVYAELEQANAHLFKKKQKKGIIGLIHKIIGNNR